MALAALTLSWKRNGQVARSCEGSSIPQTALWSLVTRPVTALSQQVHHRMR